MTVFPASRVRLVEDLRSGLAPVVDATGSSAVIVSEAGLIAAGLVAEVEAALAAEVIGVPPGEPQVGTVCELAAVLAATGADTVVAVGGGSVIDTVKLAALLVGDPAGLERRLRGAAPFPAGLAVVAVPSTAGSGAEVTRTAIVSHRGRKTWAWDERLRPERAVLAPILTLGLPPGVTVASGLDAFVHAVEAATGIRSTSEIAALGLPAAEVVFRRLGEVVDRPVALEGRAALLQAATMAGMAIDAGGTGIGHAVGHAVGSVTAIPHGVAVMLGLRAGLEWTLEEAAGAYRGLVARICPRTGVEGLPAAFDALLEGVGFRRELRRFEPPSATALSRELRMPDHLPMRLNNARPIGDNDIDDIVRLTLQYWST